MISFRLYLFMSPGEWMYCHRKEQIFPAGYETPVHRVQYNGIYARSHILIKKTNGTGLDPGYILIHDSDDSAHTKSTYSVQV